MAPHSAGSRDTLACERMMRFTSLDWLLKVRRASRRDQSAARIASKLKWQFVHMTRANTPARKKVRSREAGVMCQLPVTHFTSVAGSSHGRLAIDCEHFANAAGPAWNALCPWNGHSCRVSPRQPDAT
jgi:hypothetical protein